MDEKRNAILTIGIICGIILAFTAADYVSGDRLYSETENRMLAMKPTFTKEALFSGEYTSDYEEYVTDQFISRDKWTGIKNRADILMQKKSINGVYLGRDGYLLERHNPDDYSTQLEGSKIALLKKLVDRWNAKVMLVPTADNILTDKLPANAAYHDQRSFLQWVKRQIGQRNYVDVYAALMEHREEEIYYRTDHHWTSLGAYYGYLAWVEKAVRLPNSYDTESLVTVSENFQGTLQSRINLPAGTDRIQYFLATASRPVEVTYDYGRTTNSLYEEKYLETKNQYGFFLDDNHAFVEIQTDYQNGKTLFLIKDSYANSLIPLLTQNFETIYVVDLRYFNGKLFDFMEDYEPDNGMDVLVLYNCIHFLEDFQYYE